MKELESADYKDICRVLAPQILALAAKAKEGQCVPPLEVLITGADDDPVAHVAVDANGRVGDLAHSWTLLGARYLVTITVTDKAGKTWDATFSEETIQ